MLSVEDARTRLLAALPELPVEFAPLEDAVGRILARPLTAGFALPAFSNSSMDGFSVRAADLKSAGKTSPVALRVVEDIPAGSVARRRVGAGEAARIMTGAPVPDGADAVVPVERTDFQDRSPGSAAPEIVRVFSPVDPGAYIRQQGEDVSPGDRLLPAGVRLHSKDIGMAAMTGTASLAVTRRPKVAILSTGDELLVPGEPPAPGKIYESNSLTLAALVAGAGGEALRLGIARDNEKDVRDRLDQAVASGADLILSSAGVSVGAYDYVKGVVESAGGLDFWRVNMRPGKPLAFGSYRDVPFVGLPGNPVSTYVGFEVFLRPALAHMAGWTRWTREERTAILLEDIDSDGRESYLRAVVKKVNGAWTASLTGHQGSGNHFSLVQANALVIVPAGVTAMNAGDAIHFWELS